MSAVRALRRLRPGARSGRASATRLAAVAVLALSACSPDHALADRLCPVVRDWSAATVKAVNQFQDESLELTDPGERRAAYLQAFERIDVLGARFENQLDTMSYPRRQGREIERRMLDAARAARAEQQENAAVARQLPDSAFDAVQVADGRLFSGNEKARAVVYAAVGSLWRDFDVVDENCGRPPPPTVAEAG